MLDVCSLRYYADIHDTTKLLGEVKVQDIQWAGVDTNGGSFFHVCTRSRTYHFLAASPADASAWADALIDAFSKNMAQESTAVTKRQFTRDWDALWWSMMRPKASLYQELTAASTWAASVQNNGADTGPQAEEIADAETGV